MDDIKYPTHFQIHEDVQNLIYFVDKNGIPAFDSRILLYAMEGSNVIAAFYTKEQCISYCNNNFDKKDLPVLYTFSEKEWNTRKK